MQQLNTVGTKQGSCNGNAMIMENLPAGKTQLRMVNLEGSNSGHDTLFKLKTFGKTASVKLS
jgi:hypothetical protein